MVWGAVVRFVGKFVGKVSAKAAAKTAVKTGGKAVTKAGFKKFGVGLGIGAIGTVGLSSYLGGGGLIPSLSSFNPLSEDFSLIWFAVIAIVLIAFFAKFRR